MSDIVPNADEGKTAAQIWAEETAVTPGEVKPEPVVATPAPTPAPAAAAPAPSPAPSPAAATPPADDIYAGLHPAVAQRLRGVEGLEQRLRKNEGITGNLNSQLKASQDEVAKLKTALDQRATSAAAGVVAPTAAAVAAAAGKSEKWNQLKAEFPEWAEAVEERLGSQAPAAAVDLDALRKQIGDELAASLTTNLTASIRSQIQGETEERLVNVAHRGWKDTVKTPQFTDWMKGQPAEVQALGASPVAEDAIALLDGFRSWQTTQPVPVDPATVAAQRKQRLTDAATLVRGGASQAPVKSTDDMSAEELWAFEAANLDRVRAAQKAR